MESTCPHLRPGWDSLPEEYRDTLPYEAQHPDAFFCLGDKASPEAVRRVMVNQMKYWFDREGEVDLPGRLRRSACPEFAAHVRDKLRTIDCSLLT